jgi:hypothetical protein
MLQLHCDLLITTMAQQMTGQHSECNITIISAIANTYSNPTWLSHGLVLPDRRGMIQLWEIFLRSTYVEVFGVFHKPTTTSQILRGQLSPELALGICMHAARYDFDFHF